ncbi:catalase family peroxidase [Rhizomicrobium palustre]
MRAVLNPRAMLAMAGIGAVVLGAATAFAWAGGLFSHRLTQTRIINTFEAVNGVHPGFRRNHTKGVCLAGTFQASGDAAAISDAVVFKPGTVPVFGRFALAGGMPRTPDTPSTVRSMALNFTTSNGEVWRTGMNDIPVLPVKDVQGFYDQVSTAKPGPNGKPDPAAFPAFLKKHPEAVQAIAIIKATPFSKGFADDRYESLNAFLFVDAAGKKTPVRWAMVPVEPFQPALKTAPSDQNFLFTDLERRLAKGPVQWHLIVTIGAPGDPTNDASKMWPKDRVKIDAGVLTVSALTAEEDGNCRDINFDPMMLPHGIQPSDDPLLSARSAAYSVSFRRRAGEPKSPSAVQPPARQGA